MKQQQKSEALLDHPSVNGNARHRSSLGIEVDPKTDPHQDSTCHGEEDWQTSGGASFVGAVANMANAALGAGVLSFPYAFMNCGYILGPIVSLLFAFSMGFTLHVLAEASSLAQRGQYQTVVRELLGRTAGNIITVSMTLYLFGSCITYLDVLTDQVSNIVEHISSIPKDSVLNNRLFVVPIFTGCIVAPLCYLRKIERLEFTSVLAVISIIYLLGVILYHSSKQIVDEGPANDVVAFNWSFDIFKAVPLIAFALQCHLVFVPVYRSLKNRTVKKMDAVSAATFGTCMSIYVPVGIMGLLMFGHAKLNTQKGGDVSLLLPSTVDTIIMFAGLALTATFSYPLLQFVARSALADLIWGKGFGDKIANPENWKQYNILTTGFIIATAGVAMAAGNISNVLAFTGSTTGIVQIFVFPGVLWMRLKQTPPDMHHTSTVYQALDEVETKEWLGTPQQDPSSPPESKSFYGTTEKNLYLHNDTETEYETEKEDKPFYHQALLADRLPPLKLYGAPGCIVGWSLIVGGIIVGVAAVVVKIIDLL